jgi:hypothetical protein
MSGRVGHRKRLICVSAANLRGSHLYITGHTDFYRAYILEEPLGTTPDGDDPRLA